MPSFHNFLLEPSARREDVNFSTPQIYFCWFFNSILTKNCNAYEVFFIARHDPHQGFFLLIHPPQLELRKWNLCRWNILALTPVLIMFVCVWEREREKKILFISWFIIGGNMILVSADFNFSAACFCYFRVLVDVFSLHFHSRFLKVDFL